MDSIATNFSSFYESLATKVAQTVRIEGHISSEDVNFHRSSSVEFSESLDEQSDRLLALSSSLIKVAAAAEPGDKRRKKGVPDLKNAEDVEYNWSRIVDVIDNLLEKADTCLDEFTGIIKKLDPAQQAQAREAASRREPRNFPTIYDYGPSKIPKPQLQFERVPDARDVSPFRPLLKTKPHAIVPLEQSLQMVESDSQPALYVFRFQLLAHAEFGTLTFVSVVAIVIHTRPKFAPLVIRRRSTPPRLRYLPNHSNPPRPSGSIHWKAFQRCWRNSETPKRSPLIWSITTCIPTMDWCR